jgi:putative membrane protein
LPPGVWQASGEALSDRGLGKTEPVSSPPPTPGSPAEQAGSPAEQDAEVVDATRRTRLANERTYLAWWRTGLTSLAVGLGVGKLVPDVSTGARWPDTVVGVGFALIGVVFIAYAFVRHKRVEEAIRRGAYAPPDEHLVVALGVVGVVLGLFVLGLILTNST